MRMTSAVRPIYLNAAVTAAEALRDAGSAWTEPSALAGMTVGGLATHLGWQVYILPSLLASPPAEPAVSLRTYYDKVGWIDAGIDDEPNVRIRTGSEEASAAGPEAIAARVGTALADLRTALSAAGADATVRLPTWTDWSLRLDDFLLTRLMELLVHSDDLAVSVGTEAPAFAPEAVRLVVDLLSRLALRRHGAVPVLRALTRSERAPGTIAAF